MRYKPVTSGRYAEMATRLRKIRFTLGLNRRKFADQIDVNPESYYKQERGHVPVQQDTILKVRAATGYTADYIMTGEEQTLQLRLIQRLREVERDAEASG